MTARLNPYITFKDQARAAMEFYQSVLGGDLRMSTFGEFGMADDAAMKDLIMHAALETPDGFAIMASDTAPGMEKREGASISMSISGTDVKLRDFFDKLADGGKVTMPLERQVWGDEYGQVTDKFGVAWMIDITREA